MPTFSWARPGQVSDFGAKPNFDLLIPQKWQSKLFRGISKIVARRPEPNSVRVNH